MWFILSEILSLLLPAHLGVFSYCGGFFHPVSRDPLEGIISNIVVNCCVRERGEFRILLYTILNHDLDTVNSVKLGRPVH